MDPQGVTPREREVLQLLGDHLTHEQIGQRLFISVRTVESHVASLRRKLAMPDHRALVRHAVEWRTAPAFVSPPAALTSFVGRTRELGQLRSALDDARLVSVVGPGGVGKTRLALAAVDDREARWVDLVPVTDAAGLEGAVADACGAAPSSRRGPVEATIAALRGRRVLLILDNCEHLVNAVAVLLERLLTASQGLSVLVTSRVRLVLPFERVFRADGLSVEVGGDAVALFVERAVAAGAAPPADMELERISRVCEVLGGLALAIEMAAARLPSIGLVGVERGLLDQGALLTGGARLNPRHRSMNDALDWSVSLLPESAAAALCRVSVLVAPFDADAAVAVAAFGSLSANDVHHALARLTEHNLLAATTTSDGRLVHRMLEPVRQYGVARMTAEDQQAFAHHAAWVADRLASPEPQMITDDARSALARALAHPEIDPVSHLLARRFGLSLFRAGSLREAQLRMEQAALFAADGCADLAEAAAVAKCRVAGEDAFRLELLAADRARDPVAAALATARAAELLTRFPGMFGQLPDRTAASLVDDARARAPTDARVAAGIAVAQAGYMSTDLRAGLERSQAALVLARAAGDLLLECSALDAVSSSEIMRGDIVRAHQLSIERVRLLASRPDEPAAGLELKDALHVGSFCALGAGDLESARAMAQGQHDLPFLTERDLAEDELLCVAALSGDWATVLVAGRRFLQDWAEAGRPVAPGRGMAPAAVALAHGLQGDVGARREWLSVLAEIRGVTADDAERGTGYGEVFQAMVHLHHDAAADAFAVLTAPGDRGLYGLVFTQWAAALTAEAAVLAERPDAAGWVARAVESSAGNPVASAITRQAAALLADADPNLFEAIAADFAAAGAMYQAEQTSVRAKSRRS